MVPISGFPSPTTDFIKLETALLPICLCLSKIKPFKLHATVVSPPPGTFRKDPGPRPCRRARSNTICQQRLERILYMLTKRSTPNIYSKSLMCFWQGRWDGFYAGWAYKAPAPAQSALPPHFFCLIPKLPNEVWTSLQIAKSQSWHWVCLLFIPSKRHFRLSHDWRPICLCLQNARTARASTLYRLLTASSLKEMGEEHMFYWLPSPSESMSTLPQVRSF